MTKEEAIKLIEHISIAFVPTDQYGDYDDPEPYEEALDMAIDALSAHEPTGRIITKSSGMFQPTTWAICSKCRRPIDPWDKFCRHCGAKIEENNE